jgi:hypothetical protein
MRYGPFPIASRSALVAASVLFAALPARASEQAGPATRPARAASDSRDLRPDNVYIGVTPREPGQGGWVVYYPPFDCGPYDFYADDYGDYGAYYPPGFLLRYGCYPRAAYGYACRPGYSYRFGAPSRSGFHPSASAGGRSSAHHGSSGRRR